MRRPLRVRIRTAIATDENHSCRCCGIDPRCDRDESGSVSAARRSYKAEARRRPLEEIEQVSGEYQVDGQGFLNLPQLERIRAASLAQAELQSAIETAYRSQQIYTNPTITINVPIEARFVNVGGNVKTPRRVEFTADLTVLGAINAAGGFTEFTDRAKVRLLRDGCVSD